MKKLITTIGLISVLAACQSSQPPFGRSIVNSHTHEDDFENTPVMVSIGERSSGGFLASNIRKRPTLQICRGSEVMKAGERRADHLLAKFKRNSVKNPISADRAALLLLDLPPGNYSLCGFAILDPDNKIGKGSGSKKMLDFKLDGIPFIVAEKPVYLGEILFKWTDGYIDISIQDEHQRDQKGLHRAYIRLDDMEFEKQLLPIAEALEVKLNQ